MSDEAERRQVAGQPLVSVITPVYNGEKHLRECIDSVLAQSYQHWEYVIVDNCSTDRSLAISREYAQRDSRIRVHLNDQFVSVGTNHQIGFECMAPDSKYCKVVHADDWIFPDCIRQMVALAEAEPRVGVVSAYSLEGEWVGLGGLPYPGSVVAGRVASRLTLLRWAYLFGSPTSLLLRSECIRGHGMFYDERHFPRHFDTAACLELLREWNFGFVHQVLTYTRLHPEAQSALSASVNSYLAEGVTMLVKYGPLYLDRAECQETTQQWAARYRRFLGHSALRRRGDKFWAYHRIILEQLGWSLNPASLFGGVLADGAKAVVSRVKTVGQAVGRVAS